MIMSVQTRRPMTLNFGIGERALTTRDGSWDGPPLVPQTHPRLIVCFPYIHMCNRLLAAGVIGRSRDGDKAAWLQLAVAPVGIPRSMTPPRATARAARRPRLLPLPLRALLVTALLVMGAAEGGEFQPIQYSPCSKGPSSFSAVSIMSVAGTSNNAPIAPTCRLT